VGASDAVGDAHYPRPGRESVGVVDLEREVSCAVVAAALNATATSRMRRY
jgi:hypothetical protein